MGRQKLVMRSTVANGVTNKTIKTDYRPCSMNSRPPRLGLASRIRQLLGRLDKIAAMTEVLRLTHTP